MFTFHSPRTLLVLTLFVVVASLSARARADDGSPDSRWFASATAGYGYAFTSAGGADDSTSSNGRAFLYSAALGRRLQPWLALHGGAWGAWVPNAVAKYDQSDRERGVLRMQAVGLGLTFTAPWGGYALAAAGVASARGTEMDRHGPFGGSFMSEVGYRAPVTTHFQLGVGLQAGGFAGSLWTAAQGGIALSVAAR